MSTSSNSQPSSMSRSPSQANCLDPLDALVDFSEYEQMSSYQSPSISPSASSKPQYVRPVASTPTANNALLPSSQQTLSGPSHNYDMYKQQTGIPSGAIANTLAMNTTNMYSYNNYMSGISPGDDFLDFNTTPSFDGLTGNMEMDFDSPSESPAFFFPDQTLASSSEYVNPSVIGGQENQVMPQASVLPSTQSNNVGRLWPGMHQQQAALAKAQQQQKQQQQLIQQQRQQSMSQQSKQQRPKAHQASDPLVEEKISQLLNSMRQSSVSTSDDNDSNAHGGAGLAHVNRMRKEEEDMDEDERLLASEEGKKLSSKERRQLRNKVSARAFRSRRKEYIGQLEGEIAGKVNENSDLRMQNRALLEENTRLSDLTRMLLSSPSFSGFLDTLTPTAAPQQQQQAAPAPVAQRPAENRQVRKDVNPYVAQQQMNNQQINMALIPEHPMDFSMLDLNGDGGYSYQPQVFSVLEVPVAPIDISMLSGKPSNFVGRSFASADEKVELPVIERPAPKPEAIVEETTVVDEEFDADPMFALFSQSSASTSTAAPEQLDLTTLFGGIESEKAFARYELVDASEEVDESAANLAMARVERLCAKLDPVLARLEALTLDL